MSVALAIWMMVPVLALSADVPAEQRDRQFLDLERTLARAIHQKERDTLERLLAPGFVLRGNPDVGREKWIANALGFCWGHTSDIDDFKVRRHGDTAFTSFLYTFYRHPVTCQPAIVRSLVTSVWVRQEPADPTGGWRLVLRHAGPAAEPGSAEWLEQQFMVAPDPPAIWEGTAELSLVATGGNTETQTVGATGDLAYRPGRWTTAGGAAFIRTAAGDVESARSVALQLRQSRQVSPRLDVFARGAYRRDQFAGIVHRVTADTGLAVRIVRTPRHALTVDAGLGYLSEERAVADPVRSLVSTTVAGYRRRLNGRVEVGGTSTLTASLEAANDWRFSNAASLTSSLTQLLSLKVSHTLNYLNSPVPGFQRTDTIVSAALVAQFRRP